MRSALTIAEALAFLTIAIVLQIDNQSEFTCGFASRDGIRPRGLNGFGQNPKLLFVQLSVLSRLSGNAAKTESAQWNRSIVCRRYYAIVVSDRKGECAGRMGLTNLACSCLSFRLRHQCSIGELVASEECVELIRSKRDAILHN
jgi:hypothetical protein